jgi:hypothetical protein
MVVAVPSAIPVKIKPAVLNVVEQLLLTVQLIPSGQHLVGLRAASSVLVSVTDTAVLLLAVGLLRVTVATPLALNVAGLPASVPALVANVAVLLAAIKPLEHGLLLLAQAVMVAVVGRQLILLDGSDSS